MKRLWKIGLLMGLAVFATALFSLLVNPSKATAANPTTISFQGKVVNADGTNVTDGTYSFLFKLYTVSSAGTAIWTETQSSVTVAGGVFQVNLGSVCPFFTANACNGSTPIDFNASPSLYLGITFNGDPAGEMTPRPQLQSVPFAFNSDHVGGLSVSQLVQLSPGSLQPGFINISGAGTFGGAVSGASLQASLLQTADTSSLSTNSNNLVLRSGNATGSTSNSGNITLDAGTATGTTGTISIGTTSASGLTVGRAGITASIPGGLSTANAAINAGTGSITSGLINGQTISSTANFTGTVSTAGNMVRSGNTDSYQNTTNDANVTFSNVGGTTIAILRVLSANGIGINTATATGTGLNLNASTTNTGNSSIYFGTDTNLYRSAAATLKTDNNLIVAGTLTAGLINGQTITSAANFTGTLNSVSGYKINGTAGSTIAACSNTQSVVSMQVTGGLVVAGACGSDAALSDRRLKTNIVSLDSSILDNIKNVNSVTFDFDCSLQYWTISNSLCDSTHQTGVIAQQLAQVFPGLVTQNQYGYYTVNYKGLAVYTLKAVSEIAQHLDSQGNAELKAVTADSVHVKGDLTVDGTLTYSSLSTSAGKFSSSVITPQLVSNGALIINSGASGDVTIDSGSSGAPVNIGTAHASEVNIARAGTTTSLKGALIADGAADFNGGITVHFNAPSTTFKLDNGGTTGAVDTAIQISDSGGSGYTRLISTPNFSVGGNGDIATAGSITSKGGSFQLLDATGQQLVSFDQAGNAVIKGNLNLNSAALSGGLTVAGDVNVAGLSSFQKLATFLGKTIFQQDVQFDGHITVASDTAGYASLRTGESTVHVTFKTPYATIPVVTANIVNGQFGQTSVNNVGKEGFDINLPLAATVNTTLSWTAIAVTDPQTAANPVPAPAASTPAP